MQNFDSSPRSFEDIDEKDRCILFPKNQIQILYLKNDEEKYVEAYEAESLLCSEIVEHLNRGESVFISNKTVSKVTAEAKRTSTNPKDTVYLNRV